MNQDYTIRLETKNDYREAEQLTREAIFGTCTAPDVWSIMSCTSSGTIPPLSRSWIS